MSRKLRTIELRTFQDRVDRKKQVDKRSLVQDLLSFVFSSSPFSAKTPFHGNIKWDPCQLAKQALIWSFQDSKLVSDAFEKTSEICDSLQLKNVAKTYTGFMDAIAKYRNVICEQLRIRLQSLAEDVGGKYFRDKRWVLIGFDGSRATAPRSLSNERAFCAPTHGAGKKARYNSNKSKRCPKTLPKRAKPTTPAPPEPQVWITMMWHMGLRLPWTWRLGPSNSSERGHVQEILKSEKFPKNTLFCGDAGFVGYPLWSAILKAGGNFLVRVGANASLVGLQADIKKLSGKIVLCWPKERMEAGDPPLRLRLVSVKVGKTKMWMLTSVLDERELSKKDIAKYYGMRWLIEVEFRGLKQTIDKRKLRCRNPKRLLAELDWALHAMAFAELVALRAQTQRREKENKESNYTPKDRSLAKTCRVLRRYLRNLNQKTSIDALEKDLSNAVVQKYKNKTDKRARYRPKNKDVKPLGDPIITKLTPEQRRKIREIETKNAA